jgi:hypothetical protein
MPRKRLIAIASVTLLAAPPIAVAGGPPTDPGNSAQAHARRPATLRADPPGPQAPATTKARAYGWYCRKESKKHIAGQKGTPFSQCVTALAKLATGWTSNPARACANLSKKHAAGQVGTAYSKCVAAADRLGSKAGAG